MNINVSEPLTVRQQHDNGAVSVLPAQLETSGVATLVRFEVTLPQVGPAVWTFPRSLLDEALSGPALDGACRAWPDSPWHLGLSLPSSATTSVTYWLPTSVVQRFVDRALGAEWAVLNGALS